MLTFSTAANKSDSFNFSKFGGILVFKKPLIEKKRIRVINSQHSWFVGYVKGNTCLQKNMEASPCSGWQTNHSLPTSPSQVPLYNRYEALDVEGQSIDDVDDGPSTPEVLPRSERPTPPYHDHLHEEDKTGYSCR